MKEYLFVRHPYYAVIPAILTVLCGILAIFLLPVAQYPNVTPIEVDVTITYPGADSTTILQSVTEPLEKEINGVQNLIYLTSESSDSGTALISCFFEVGSDGEVCTQNVQSRVNWASSQLPQAVQDEGIIVQEKSSNILLAIMLRSTDGRFDENFLSNYGAIHLQEALARLPGVADVSLFGGSDYAMRVWLDSDKMAAMNLTPEQVVSALETQNLQVSAGSFGSAPAGKRVKIEMNLQTRGRLQTPLEFGEIIVRGSNSGGLVRLSEIAELEMGSESYSSQAAFDGQPGAILLVFQRVSANGIAIADECRKLLDEAAKDFPPGMSYAIPYDSTLFIRDSIRNVAWTLLFASLLVALVTWIFLQDLRMVAIPVAAIAVSIVGTFAILLLLGFSLNLVTLFALILAIGIVVDDAIIVIENVSRLMETQHLAPREAAEQSIREISGAIVATTGVLLAMFLPVSFLSGITGELYRQFALTLSAAVLLSAINALTLSPALCAQLLRKADANEPEKRFFLFRIFDQSFLHSKNLYLKILQKIIVFSTVIFGGYLIFSLGVFFFYSQLPHGFVPPEDQSVIFANLELPEDAALNVTSDAVRQADFLLRNLPGVRHVVSVAGYNILDSSAAENCAFLIALLDPISERLRKNESEAQLSREIQGMLLERFPTLFPMVFAPPPIPGIGMAEGFNFILLEKSSTNVELLQKYLDIMLFEASKSPYLTEVFTTFNASRPVLRVEIDRAKAFLAGVSLEAIDNALESFFGYRYINEFNRFGQVYKLEIQNAAAFRDTPQAVLALHVPNASGEMVELSSLATLYFAGSAPVLSRYNLSLSAAIQGAPASSEISSGDAMMVMSEIAEKVLPQSMGFAWSDLSFQEAQSSGKTIWILGLAIVFIYLFLSALYESFLLPGAVLWAIPGALSGALGGCFLLHVSNNIYTQIGFVLLCGMVCKTSILIVTFAHDARRASPQLLPQAAALQGATLRYRALLMTAFAFILGSLPLLLAKGAGSGSSRSIGSVVVFGMMTALITALFGVPLFFTLHAKIRDYFVMPHHKQPKKSKKIASSSHPKPPILFPLLFLFILLFLSGCYTPPQGADWIERTSYSNHAEPQEPQNWVFESNSENGTLLLSLEQAQTIALANNPDFRSTFDAIESAKYQYYQTFAAYSPTISAATAVGAQLYRAIGNNAKTDHVGYSYTVVQANYLIFDGLSREFSVLVAEHNRAREAFLNEHAARLLCYGVTSAFDSCLNSEKQLEIARETLDFQSEQLQQGRVRRKIGTISQSDLLHLQNSRNLALQHVIECENERRSSRFALAALLGNPTGTLPENLILQENSPKEIPLSPIDSYLDSALANRADLNAYREELTMARYSFYQTYSMYSPTLSAFANYSYSSASTAQSGNNPTGFGYFYMNGNSFNYGGVASWDLFEGFLRYNLTRQARNELNQAYWEGSSKYLAVIREIRDAYSAVVMRHQLLAVARENEEVATTERSLVAEEYRVGSADLLRLDSAITNSSNARETLAAAEINLHRAIAKLHQLSAWKQN